MIGANSFLLTNFVNFKIIIDKDHQIITKILGNSLKILEVLCKFMSP